MRLINIIGAESNRFMTQKAAPALYLSSIKDWTISYYGQQIHKIISQELTRRNFTFSRRFNQSLQIISDCLKYENRRGFVGEKRLCSELIMTTKVSNFPAFETQFKFNILN